MKRSMDKALQEYKKLVSGQDGTKHAFYVSDILQIENKYVTDNAPIKLFGLIADSLGAGYAIGYRTAMRHAKQNPLT